MKNQTITNRFIRYSLAMALALASGYLSGCAGQRTDASPEVRSQVQSQSSMTAGDKNMIEAKMKDRCQAMMEQKQKMMEEMKAQDAELNALVAKMNSAPKDKKVGLIAAVVTRMAEQRTAMHARKAKMEEEMMTHMMQHMRMGTESMAPCPMMKGMKNMDETSAGAHKEHQ